MSDRGAVHLTLVMLLLGATLLLGLAAGITRVASAWRRASFTAATAAEIGASWIDHEAARSGDLLVDEGAARAAAFAAAAGAVDEVEVATTTERVCVTASVTVEAGVLATLGAAPKTVSATACAEPRRG